MAKRRTIADAERILDHTIEALDQDIDRLSHEIGLARAKRYAFAEVREALEQAGEDETPETAQEES